MKNRTIMIMLSAAAAVFFIFVAAVEAQVDCSCPSTESDSGECARIRNRYGNFTGYIIKLIDFSYYQSSQLTTGSYQICIESGYSPKKISHVDLELPICTKDDGTPIHCYVENVIDPTTSPPENLPYEVKKNGRGDPSTYFLKWFPSDLLKIDKSVFAFEVTLSGEAYKTRGSFGIKAGKEMLTAQVLVPVCDASCGLYSYAAATGTEDEPVTVETETGYKFDLLCDGSTGCCRVIECYDPAGNHSPDGCKRESFDGFFDTTKGDVTNMTSGDVCLNLVVNDTSKTSPSYCSGGWCWYW